MNASSVTVGSILNEKGSFVACVAPDASVLDAARRMNDLRIGSLVVTDAEQVIGIITERDILTKIVAACVDPAATKVRAVMSSPVACCKANTTAAECRGVMTRRRIRHLPAVDEQGRLIGIITSGDLMAREVAAQQETIEYLQQYILGG